jgi:hypothetical protein
VGFQTVAAASLNEREPLAAFAARVFFAPDVHALRVGF